jgi:coenzyme PQQ precursor peptide PqqA
MVFTVATVRDYGFESRKVSTMKKSIWTRPTFTVTSTGFEVTMYLGT